MRYYFISFLVLLLVFLGSCQPSGQLQDWFSFFKDKTLTNLASESSSGVLTEEEKAQLFVLFLDMEETRNCAELVRLVESNEFLEEYEEEYKLKKGFLFDIFNGYTYEAIVFSGLNLNQELEQLARVISNTWKTKFSTTRINSVLADLTYCYPY